MAGDEELAAIIAGLRKIGGGFEELAAKEAAPLVEQAVRATAAAGTDPYGTPWPPKKDGTRALPEAAGAVTATAKGPVVQIATKGGYAIQGRLKGDARRQVIPSGDRPLPKQITDALKEGARRAWRKAMGQ